MMRGAAFPPTVARDQLPLATDAIDPPLASREKERRFRYERYRPLKISGPRANAQAGSLGPGFCFGRHTAIGGELVHHLGQRRVQPQQQLRLCHAGLVA